VTFPLIDIHPRSCLQIIDVPLREPAVRRIPIDLEIDIPVDTIRHSLGEQRVDKPHNVGDMFRRPGFERRAAHTELLHILVIGVDVGGGDVLAAHALFIRPLDDLVIDIREVLGKLDDET
jgi:hypothetical protein